MKYVYFSPPFHLSFFSITGTSPMDSFDVIICGSGPAGLSAGLAAVSHGAAAVILDRDHMAGRKLCATGNGRCNLTNSFEGMNSKPA